MILDSFTLLILLLVPAYIGLGGLVLMVLIESKLMKFKNEIYHTIYYIVWPIFIVIELLLFLYRKIFKSGDHV